MVVLSDNQVQSILDDLRRKGIKRKELQLDLLDHICCLMEEEMDQPSDFQACYDRILPQFFRRELQEIQAETDLLFIFKNYYTMKKMMLYSGGITAILFTVGAWFKIMHWPGAAILLVGSIFIFSTIFLPLLSVLKVKEVKPIREKLIIAIAAIFALLFCVSVMFKIMHWPFANIMWLLALGILMLCFLPIYFFGGIRNPETRVNTMVSSVLILIAGGLLFTLTNLKSSKWTEDIGAIQKQQIQETIASFDVIKAKGTDEKKSEWIKQSEQLRFNIMSHMEALEHTAHDQMDYHNPSNHVLLKELTDLQTELSRLAEKLTQLSDRFSPHYLYAANYHLPTINEDLSWKEMYFMHNDLREKIRNWQLIVLRLKSVELSLS